MMLSLSNDILKIPTQKFDFQNPPIDPKILYNEMREVLIYHKGFGLSCNQVGLPYSMFVIGNPENSNEVMEFFNPNIVNFSEEKTKMEEGCLSFPGLSVKIERSQKIRVRFAMCDGKIQTQTFTGLTARIIQHEYDHIQGKLFTKKLGKVGLKMALDKAQKRGYRYSPANFI